MSQPHDDDVTREFFLPPDSAPTEEFRRVEAPPSSTSTPSRVTSLAALFGVLAIAVAALALPDRIGLLVAVVAIVQAGLCLIWTWVTKPEMPAGLFITGGGTAIAADLAALLNTDQSLKALALVAAGGFGLAITVQLARGRARHRVTMTLGQHVTVVMAMVGFASLPMLLRFDGGGVLAQVAVLCVGVALACAYLLDLAIPRPAVHADVARGLIGAGGAILAGLICGAILLPMLADDAFNKVSFGNTVAGALLGAVVAFVAVIADIATAYDGAVRTFRPSGFKRVVSVGFGPLLGLAVTGPACYLVGPALLNW
ncbi:MAG: hypothetical protein HOQ05_02080 [Corynebacteriales bacterium]|nr:hypothetical protein [Mycobacteriales bacterium]